MKQRVDFPEINIDFYEIAVKIGRGNRLGVVALGYFRRNLRP